MKRFYGGAIAATALACALISSCAQVGPTVLTVEDFHDGSTQEEHDVTIDSDEGDPGMLWAVQAWSWCSFFEYPFDHGVVGVEPVIGSSIAAYPAGADSADIENGEVRVEYLVTAIVTQPQVGDFEVLGEPGSGAIGSLQQRANECMKWADQLREADRMPDGYFEAIPDLPNGAIGWSAWDGTTNLWRTEMAFMMRPDDRLIAVRWSTWGDSEQDSPIDIARLLELANTGADEVLENA
ncbi:MAG: hypothetical protein ACK5KU_09265 [Beutenbergiaceae bacterium]